MPQFESQFYGYAADALSFNSASGTFTLKPGFGAADRVLFETRDNDAFMDGDEKNDETGEGADQRGTVTDGQGNQIASGRIYGEERIFLRAPDGSTISIDAIEVDGVLVGYMPSAPLQPGVSYSRTGSEDIDNLLGGRNGRDTRRTYEEYERSSVPCFGPGTLISTQDGEIPVEWLEPGDKVLTRDHGFQPVLWLGRTRLPSDYFAQYPEDAPVRIPAGALGKGSPSHDLEVTGDHSLLIRSALAEMLFSSSEVFAPSKAWVDAGLAERVLPQGTYTLTHILCQSHEVIMAQGAWVESLFLGAQTLARLNAPDAERVKQLAATSIDAGQTARLCLSRSEALMLLRHDTPVKARSTGRLARSA